MAEDPTEEPEPDDEDAPETAERSSQWNWWLVVIPALAVLTLVIVLLYGANTLSPQDIHGDLELVHIVIAGSVVFVGLLVAEIVLLAGGHPEHLEDEEEPAPGPETPAAREEMPPEAADGDSDLEALATDDEVEGHRVLELARPPKEAVGAGVYSTTYVEIDQEQILRVEELVAQRTA